MRTISNWTVLTAAFVVVVVLAFALASSDNAFKIGTAAAAILGVVAIALDGLRSIPSRKGPAPQRDRSSFGAARRTDYDDVDQVAQPD